MFAVTKLILPFFFSIWAELLQRCSKKIFSRIVETTMLFRIYEANWQVVIMVLKTWENPKLNSKYVLQKRRYKPLGWTKRFLKTWRVFVYKGLKANSAS